MNREDRPPRCAGLNYSRARDFGEYAGESVAPLKGRTVRDLRRTDADYRAAVIERRSTSGRDGQDTRSKRYVNADVV